MDTNPNRNDRDMLIMLNTKVDQMGFDIKDLKEGVLERLVKVETRLDAEDVFHAAIPLDHYKANSEWVDNFKSNYKLILFFIGLASAAFGGFIDHLLTKFFKF